MDLVHALRTENLWWLSRFLQPRKKGTIARNDSYEKLNSCLCNSKSRTVKGTRDVLLWNAFPNSTSVCQTDYTIGNW